MRERATAAVLPFVALASVTLLAFLVFSSSPSAQPSRTPDRVTRVQVSSTYAYLSLDDQMQQARAIFCGQVAAISPTRWNQDSGTYWQAPGHPQLPYYTVDVTIAASLHDTLSLGSHVTITVLGSSPQGTDHARSVETASDPISLRVGEMAVFFVDSSAIAWRGADATLTRRPIVRFLIYPDYSYLLQQADGTLTIKDPQAQVAMLTMDELKQKVRATK
jgi:hypothetical protein